MDFGVLWLHQTYLRIQMYITFFGILTLVTGWLNFTWCLDAFSLDNLRGFLVGVSFEAIGLGTHLYFFLLVCWGGFFKVKPISFTIAWELSKLGMVEIGSLYSRVHHLFWGYIFCFLKRVIKSSFSAIGIVSASLCPQIQQLNFLWLVYLKSS